jgi:hypothetical protein
MVELTAIPSARDRVAAATKPGLRANERIASLSSVRKAVIGSGDR